MALFPLTNYDFPNVTNYDGDLLYKVDGERWSTYTEAQLKERDLTPESEGVTPYHKPIYTSTPWKEEEMSTWDKRNVEAYTRVIAFLERYLEEA